MNDRPIGPRALNEATHRDGGSSQARTSVLFVSSRADKGAGGETYLLRVLRYLDRARFRPVVVLPHEGTLIEELSSLEVNWHIVEGVYGWIKQPAPWYRLLADTRKRVDQLRSLFERERISLVHTNSNHRVEGALAARLSGVHHLYLAHIEYQHDMPVFVRFPLARESYAHLMGELSSQVVCVSRSVADTLSPFVPADRIQVINNGVELDALDTSAAAGGSIRSELGLPDSAVLVSAVGRINPDKGFDFLVECAHQVLAQDASAHFLLIGSAEVQTHSDALRGRVRELGIEERFHFLGFRSDVPSLLRQSDIFVLSSRREGHPYVLLEAMGCGCPAIASRCAGVEETLVEGETGYTVDIGDVDGLAAGIARLVADPDLRRRMGAAARKRVEDRFQAVGMVEQLMAAYDRTLARPAPPGGSAAVDLFLNATTEIGHLGRELEDVKERLRTLEGRMQPLVSNPVTDALRRIRSLKRRRD
jgi:glycosyltransferase involved in cell wall biosynthesis